MHMCFPVFDHIEDPLTGEENVSFEKEQVKGTGVDQSCCAAECC